MPRDHLALACAMLVATTTIANAETVLIGEMDGSVLGTDSPATGTMTLVLNDAQDAVDYTISYNSLVGDETISHFHNAPPGEFGRIVLELPDGNPKVDTWDIPAVLVGELLSGRIYVVIHTTTYPGGEIGGWVSVSTATDETTPWSAIRNLYR